MKKSEVSTLVCIFFVIGVTLFLPLLVSAGVLYASYTAQSPFDGKITAAFLVFFNGWYYYVLYHVTMRKLAQREANAKNGLTIRSGSSTNSDAKTGLS